MKAFYQKTIEDLEADATAGDARALVRVADALRSGLRGASVDPARALQLERQAAELGHAGAACTMGDYYFRGRGVPQDRAEARRWYTRAAQLGNVDAMANLLDGLKSDDAAARAESQGWLVKAALLGQPHAVHLATGGLAGSLREFAAQSLEQIAQQVAEQPDELTGTFEVEADAAQLNTLLGETMARLEATWPDLTVSAEVDGDTVDVPGPTPHEALDGEDLELTIYAPLRHVQINFYRKKTRWELVFASFEPHPTPAERDAIFTALREAAAELAVGLQQTGA